MKESDLYGIKKLNMQKFYKELQLLKERGFSFTVGKKNLWEVFMEVQDFEDWKAKQRSEKHDWACDVEYTLRNYTIGN